MSALDSWETETRVETLEQLHEEYQKEISEEFIRLRKYQAGLVYKRGVEYLLLIAIMAVVFLVTFRFGRLVFTVGQFFYVNSH